MANEIGSIGEGLEEGGGIREDINKVTEEAVRRIQENQKKAKQIAQQIQDDKAVNAKFAQFLEFLLRHTTNEKLIKTLYQTFFKTKHPKTNITYLRKSINTIVIVGMFAPFYPNETKKFGLETVFQKLTTLGTAPTLTGYVHYLKELSKTYHDNIPIDKENFIAFLVELLGEYKLIHNAKMSEDEQNELKSSLSKELYGK
ncbi:MAG: hypothetical protein WC875_05740 [Candidatus Absconditabacterales bacterium]